MKKHQRVGGLTSLIYFACLFLQDLNNEVKDKYATVEQLIDQKAGGVADAKKRAQALQQEAKELLLKAGDKLRLLKGKNKK